MQLNLIEMWHIKRTGSTHDWLLFKEFLSFFPFYEAKTYSLLDEVCWEISLHIKYCNVWSLNDLGCKEKMFSLYKYTREQYL